VDLQTLYEFVTRDLWGNGTAAEPGSLVLFQPELILCGTIVLMLLARVLDPFVGWADVLLKRGTGTALAWVIALAGLVWALWAAAPWLYLNGKGEYFRAEMFTGMLVFDAFTAYMRAVLLVFGLLFLFFTRLSGIPDQEDAQDFYTLIIGATLGMMLMASANHLLMVFLAVEMASVPSYALAGILKGRSESSEAALKYSVYGAGTAGVMLYGISLLAGVLGSAHMPTMAVRLAENWTVLEASQLMILALGALMVMVGLAFKLSAVPFHFWCPDVFEGASAEVNAFLSVASKAAALALLVRVCLGFGHVPKEQPIYGPPPRAVAAVAPNGEETPVALVADPAAPPAHPAAPPAGPPVVAPHGAAETPAGAKLTPERANARLAPVCDFLSKLIAFLAVITCTFGNLAAYGQTNIKRLMAYSTIAHAGYMMMAVPAALALAPVHPEGFQAAVAALGIYIGVYLFMNLGVFVIIAFVRNACGGSEEIDDYSGLVRQAPVFTICFAVILFSLVGMPPLAGFIGKFAVFAALFDAYRETGQAYLMMTLVLGGLNTVFSLYYYLRVVKVMTIDAEPADRAPLAWESPWFQGLYVVAITIPTIGLFFSWTYLLDWARAAAATLQ
jgi:NADH-quinone oxidoreductase subunit N